MNSALNNQAISLKVLIEQLSPLISPIQLSNEIMVSDICPVEASYEGSLVFASDSKQLNLALKSPCQAIVTSAKLIDETISQTDKILIPSANPYLAMAKALELFRPTQWIAENSPQIHPSANIHVTAEIGKNVFIGANSTIQAGCIIGDHTIIRENVVIDQNCQLGAHCHIFPLVHLGRRTQMGNGCIIQSMTVIGSEGFGYAPDEKGVFHHIPHRGRVVFGDNVEVGASSTIDRGTFEDTVIGSGCKVDNQVHIAHNCNVGENTIFTGGFMMAGSTKVGKHVIVGAGSRILGHLEVVDHVVLAAGSEVMQNIRKVGTYGGDPLVPIEIHKKNYVSLKKIAEMRSNISALMKKVFETDSSTNSVDRK